MQVKVKLLSSDSKLPTYAHNGDSGADVYSTVDAEIRPGWLRKIPIGLAFEVEAGWELQVRPKSGIASDHGVTVLNSPGTIDEAFRGEVQVTLINHGDKTYVIKRGQKVAQIVLCPQWRAEWEVTEELTETVRGDKGWGSTGLT
jgi:dUTP pyrophosphatase